MPTRFMRKEGNLLPIWILGFCLLAWLFMLSDRVNAGVFTLPHFVEPERYSLGIEPQLTLTNGAGLGAELKFTYGLNSMSNLGFMAGTGDGNRRTRGGAFYVFDLFPDLEDQPGIGLATQLTYTRLRNFGRMEATLLPYLHETIKGEGGNEFEPFIGIPFGLGFRSDRIESLWSLAVGSLFKKGEHFIFSIELGIAIDHTDSYVSSGVAYYY